MDLRSGDAYWPIRNGLLRSYPPLSADTYADVVVVGAGVTGAVVAHALATAGAEVVVLDRRDVVSGSSAATTGLLMYETDVNLGDLIAQVGEVDAVRAWRLGLAAIDDIGALVGLVGDRCGFERRPTLYVASSSDDVKGLATECAIRRGHGFDVEWLEAGPLRERYGVYAQAAILSQGDAEIDCYRFTHAVLSAASGMGTRVHDRTDVVAVEPQSHSLVIRTGRGTSVRARHIVWAAGYEGVEETQKRVGRLHSTWVVSSEPVGRALWPESALIWESTRPYLYVRTTDDGRVLVGGEDEPFHRRHANDRENQEDGTAPRALRGTRAGRAVGAGLRMVWRLLNDPRWLALHRNGTGAPAGLVGAGLRGQRYYLLDDGGATDPRRLERRGES